MMVFFLASQIIAISQTWENVVISSEPKKTPIFNITVNPLNPYTMYGGVQIGGIFYRSFDGGNTWDTVLCEKPYIDGFQALAVSPADTNVILTATGQPMKGVYRSTNMGKFWNTVTIPKFAMDTSMYPNDTKYMVNSESIMFDKDTLSNAFLGTNVSSTFASKLEAWFCKSTDNGATWDTIYNFTAKHNIYALCGLTQNKMGALFQGAVGGYILKSDDKGYTWKVVYKPDVDALGQKTPIIKFSANNPNIGFAAQTRSEKGVKGGILKTNDGGNTWFKILNQDTSYWALELAEVGDKITITTAFHGYNDPSSKKHIIQSTDGGFGWNKIDNATTPWPQKNGPFSIHKILYNSKRPSGREYFFTTNVGTLMAYLPLSTGVLDTFGKHVESQFGVHLQQYIFNINLRDDIKNVDIYAITGEQVLSFTTTQSSEQLSHNIRELANGTYYAVVTTSKGNIEHQMVLQY